MAKFKIATSTMQDPNQMRAIFDRFGKLTPTNTDPNSLFREYQVDIPGFGNDEFVEFVFTMARSGLVTITDIRPDINTIMAQKVTNLQEVYKTLIGYYRMNIGIIEDFMQSLRYDYYSFEDMPKEFVFMEHEFKVMNTIELYNRFEIFAGIKPLPEVMVVRPTQGKQYKVRSKISDIVSIVDSYRLDHSKLIEVI